MSVFIKIIYSTPLVWIKNMQIFNSFKLKELRTKAYIYISYNTCCKHQQAQSMHRCNYFTNSCNYHCNYYKALHILSKGVCHFSFVVFRRLFFFHETLQIFFWYCFFHGLTFGRHFEIFRESLFSYKWLLLIFYTWNLIDKFNKIFWFMIIYLMIFQVFHWKWRCFWGFEWYTELNICWFYLRWKNLVGKCQLDDSSKARTNKVCLLTVSFIYKLLSYTLPFIRMPFQCQSMCTDCHVFNTH